VQKKLWKYEFYSKFISSILLMLNKEANTIDSKINILRKMNDYKTYKNNSIKIILDALIKSLPKEHQELYEKRLNKNSNTHRTNDPFL
jgi:hypothetical protein